MRPRRRHKSSTSQNSRLTTCTLIGPKRSFLLPAGILEEHGPYLPTFTDGYLNEQLTQALAESIIAAKPGWRVLVFPTVPLGNRSATGSEGELHAGDDASGVEHRRGLAEERRREHAAVSGVVR